ncbi:MAG: RnfABCDGE type electron transport complex subunit B [Anaerolineaceae bacterium]|nr:RnfABCDGE type electron transport complex subunit B [Anaerolineaceae bacterium]
MDTTLIAISTMGGLGLFFAVILAFADKKLRVEENPLVTQVYEALPNVNCGACGTAGCYDFAVHVVGGKRAPNGCPVGGAETAQQIASLLGVEAGKTEIRWAFVLCRGGEAEAAKKPVRYTGPTKCAPMALVAGGDKLCAFGCLGGGDCVVVCPVDAIYMNDNGLPVVIEERCTGCELCAKACPRNIIEIHPYDRPLMVYCKNLDDPRTARKICTAACIACGICARPSEGVIVVENNLARVTDFDKLNLDLIPVDKCPTKAIQIHKVPTAFERTELLTAPVSEVAHHAP